MRNFRKKTKNNFDLYPVSPYRLCKPQRMTGSIKRGSVPLMGNASSFVLSTAGYGKGLCFIKHKNKLNFSI